MAAVDPTLTIGASRCELCGARIGNARDRIAHLRSEHSAYARGVFARLAAPFVFLAAIGVLGAFKAPATAYLVALVASYGLLFFGKVGSRSARKREGARATMPLIGMLRQGGARFVLLIPVALLVLFLVSR